MADKIRINSHDHSRKSTMPTFVKHLCQRFILGGFHHGLPTPETSLGHHQRHVSIVVSLINSDYDYGNGAISAEECADAKKRVWASKDIEHLRDLVDEILIPLGYTPRDIDQDFATQFTR